MDGNQPEEMEVEASEHIDMTAMSAENSNPAPGEEADVSQDPFARQDEEEEGDKQAGEKKDSEGKGGSEEKIDEGQEKDSEKLGDREKTESERKKDEGQEKDGNEKKKDEREKKDEGKEGDSGEKSGDEKKTDTVSGSLEKAGSENLEATKDKIDTNEEKKDCNEKSKEDERGSEVKETTVGEGGSEKTETEQEKGDKEKDVREEMDNTDANIVNEEESGDKAEVMECDTIENKDTESESGANNTGGAGDDKEDGGDEGKDNTDDANVVEIMEDTVTSEPSKETDVDPLEKSAQENKEGEDPVDSSVDKDAMETDPIDLTENSEAEPCEVIDDEQSSSKKNKPGKVKKKSGQDDEDIVELPVYKKPAEVVDLAEDEAEKNKDETAVDGGSDESTSDGNRRIKLRSLASLVDSSTSQEIPAIGEIVEHGLIIGSDEMDGLGLRISNVVGGEDCITGLTIDEDRDSFSSIQISSVSTLADPMSPEDPNKDTEAKDDENEKATEDGEGKTDGSSSPKPSEDTAEKGIKIVNSESLKDKEDGATKPTEDQPLAEVVPTGGDDSQKTVGCIYHILRSILTVERECEDCHKKVRCDFRITKKGESGTWGFLCTLECRTQWTTTLPPDQQVEKPRLIFEKLCGMCGKDLANVNRSGQFSWETREFCTRKCLTTHLQVVAGECHMCREAVRAMFIGKYCVRFGSDIHQFCSNSCLERYKTKIKVCCYCQKNLDKAKRVTSMANKAYCSMKCLKRAQRRDIGQQNYSENHPCTVCVSNRLNRYEFLSNQETFQLCSDACLNVYKYANKVKAVSCCLCFRVMNAEDVAHYLYQGGHQLRVFCSDSCVNVFILSARKIVVCNYCKVKKYNFDMIHRQVDEDFRDYFYCSLNCLNNKEPGEAGKGPNDSAVSSTATTNGAPASLDSSDAPLTLCNMCNSMAKPQFHMVMSDNTLRSFCRYTCASKYKTTYGFQINDIQSSESQPSSNSSTIIRSKNTPEVTTSASRTTETVPAKSKNSTTNTVSQSTATATAELLSLLNPPIMVNKMTSCRPNTLTKGVYCKPHPWHRQTQTEQTDADIEAPRSRGTFTTLNGEQLDLDDLSVSSESEVGDGLSDSEMECSVAGSEKEQGTVVGTEKEQGTLVGIEIERESLGPLGKRKANDDLQEGPKKARKLDSNSSDKLRNPPCLPSVEKGSCTSLQQLWTWDFTSKFVPNVKTFDSSSSGVSPSCNLTETSSELDFLCLFLDQEIINHLCLETQRYHQQRQPKMGEVPEQSKTNFEDLDSNEMYRFLGLSMLMAYYRKTNTEDYWRIAPFLSTSAINQLMSEKRYSEIMQYLHFVNNAKVKRNDLLGKIRPVLDHLQEKFRNIFTPHQELSVNDNLTLRRGASVGMNHPVILKCFLITDVETGVVVDLFGCDMARNEMDKDDLLMQKLLSKYYDKNHVVYLPGMLTSPRLIKVLQENKMGAVGQVSAARECMPKLEKVKQGCTVSAHSHNMVAIKWRGWKMPLLSTIHEDVMEVDSNRNNSSQAVKESKALVDYRTKMQITRHSHLINTGMGTGQRSRKWYISFFFHLLDVALLNAHRLYQAKTGKKLMFRDFQRNVIQQLFERFPPVGSAPSEGVLALSRLNAPHYPAPLPAHSNPSSLGHPCHVCANTKLSEKKKSLTKIMCIECDVHLCQVPCFANYHKLKQY